jgi:hypothetical protein
MKHNLRLFIIAFVVLSVIALFLKVSDYSHDIYIEKQKIDYCRNVEHFVYDMQHKRDSIRGHPPYRGRCLMASV